MDDLDAVYFTCGRDFELLEMSVISLLRLEVCRSILVVADGRDPLVEKQQRRLGRLSSGITMVTETGPVERHGASGVHAVAAAVRWFGRLARQTGSGHVVKLDSDTLILRRDAFDHIRSHGPPAAGSLICVDGLTFWRGASYSLRRDLIDRLENLVSAADFVDRIDALLDHDSRVIAPASYHHRYPEDRVVYRLLARWPEHTVTFLDHVLDVESDDLPDALVRSSDVLHFPGSAKVHIPRFFERWVAANRPKEQ